MKLRTHEDRHCLAHKSNGDPCRARPIAGGTVCRVHGGSAPQVKRAAEERIADMVDPALTQLLRIVRSGDSDAVQLAAIKDVLDRAGYKPKEKVDLNVGYGRLSDDELEARIAEFEGRAGSLPRLIGGA